MPNPQGSSPQRRVSRMSGLLRSRGALLFAVVTVALLVFVLASFPSTSPATAAPAETATVDEEGLADPYAGPDVDELDAALDQFLGAPAPETGASIPTEETEELLPALESLTEALAVQEPGVTVERTVFGTIVTLDLTEAGVAPNADGVIALARSGGGDVYEVETGTVDGEEVPAESLAYLNEDSVDLDYVFVRVEPGTEPKTISLTLTTDPIEDTADYRAVASQNIPSTLGLFQEAGPSAMAMLAPLVSLQPDAMEVHPDDEVEIDSTYNHSNSRSAGTEGGAYVFVRADETATLSSIVVRINSSNRSFLEMANSPRLWYDGIAPNNTVGWPYQYLPGQPRLEFQAIEMDGNRLIEIRIPVELAVDSGEYLRLHLPFNFNDPTAETLEIHLMAAPAVDLGIEKTFTGIQDGRFTWDVKVTNRSTYGSRGFTVDDVVPAKYTGVRVDSYGNSGWITPPTLNGNTLAFSHGRLVGDATATFKLSAAAVPDSSQCMENTATVTGGDVDPVPENNTDSDGACPLQVKKTILDVNGDGRIDVEDTNQPGPVEGALKVSYTVEVTYDSENPAAPATDTYTLTDTPRFPGEVPVMGGRVTSDRAGYTPIDFPAGTPAPWTLTPGPVMIAKGQTHKYTIDVYYTPPQEDPTNKDWALCTDDIPSRGLYNEATITTSQLFTFTDDACAPIVKDMPVTMELIKHGDDTSNPLNGAVFALYAANEDGLLGEWIKDFTAGVDGRHLLEEIDPDESYFIVEKQSPQDYSLLPSPVRVDIARDADGKATATIDESSQLIARLGDAPDKDTIVITVANVRIGDLPDTGGIGVWPFMLVAVGLFAGAAATARRKA